MGLFDRLDRRLDKLADQLGELIGPDDVRAHVELGHAYLTAGNLEGASRELSAALGLRPDHARALYLLGMVHEKRGDRPGARDLYVQAGLRESFVEPHLALGHLSLTDGDLDAAAESYRHALDQGGDLDARAEAYRGLGLAHLRAGRFDRAVRELRKAVATAPDDPTAQTLLGRALLGKGDLDTARLCLERATRKEPAPPEAWAALGEVLAALGRKSDAEQAFRAALAGIAASPVGPELAESEVAARLGLAKLDRDAGRLEDARIGALAALERSPSHLGLLVELGQTARLLGTPEVALEAFDRALAGEVPQTGRRALSDPRPLLSEALSLSLASGHDERAEGYARALLERRSDDPSARAALALAALKDGDVERADSELALAANAGSSIEHHLARAQVALARADRSAALSELRYAAQLAPSDPRPRSRYAALFARVDPPAGDVPALLAAAHRLASSSPELSELAPALGRLRESLDRPLVVTVMGEFNAGKSTFVNAFLGEEVAPMGVTPTTATVNLLKYGAERKGRVHYHDERTRELAWADVPAFLKGLRDDEAKQIRLVELLYPLETLQRINVVDTPGLNSIHAEHEEVARRYIEEADAVIWLFSVDQAAKASEGEALDRIATQGRKVLGVVNKIDRADESERAQIIQHIQRSLGSRLETIVPVSARAALAARKSGDAA
ncbi:MAG: tetratricopeptide repeat protein, partial [Polyangia bacterium]